jgi:hypothetical protein
MPDKTRSKSKRRISARELNPFVRYMLYKVFLSISEMGEDEKLSDNAHEAAFEWLSDITKLAESRRSKGGAR